MNNIVTLQLSVPALEKLFEGDPQFAVSLKQAVITEFSRRKLGDLLNQSAKADIDHAIATQVGTITSKGYGYAPQITLQKPILEHIQAETNKAMEENRKAITQTISDAADQAVTKITEDLEARVKKVVESRLTTEITARVNAEVTARMNKIMKAAQS